MQRRALLVSLALLGLVVFAPARAHALLFDMDQISTPQYTEPGAQSIRPCTYVNGATPNAGCSFFANFGTAGYATGEEPIGDFRAQPLVPVALLDLWSDGHRALASGATLVLSGLAPGPYDVTVMSHNPVGTTLDSTIFQVGDLDEFEIVNVPNPTPGSDLFALQARTVSVLVGASGTLSIGYRAGNDDGSPGVLNGVSLVPEPSTLLLLGAGLVAIARGSIARR